MQQHALFRTYPSEEEPGLRIFVPCPAYMLAMKLMALRIDPASEQKDLADILSLLQIVGLEQKQDIVAFAARFYPEARVSGKLALAVDYLWNAFSAQQQAANEPPRYLGRGGPPQ